MPVETAEMSVTCVVWAGQQQSPEQQLQLANPVTAEQNRIRAL